MWRLYLRTLSKRTWEAVSQWWRGGSAKVAAAGEPSPRPRRRAPILPEVKAQVDEIMAKRFAAPTPPPEGLPFGGPEICQIERDETGKVTSFDVRGGNRADRRRWERARRRHDKFVTPAGPEPEKIERPPPEPRPKKVPAAVPFEDVSEDGRKDAEYLIVDTHHEGGDHVLYKEAEVYGEFNFRDTILEQLETYFIYLERMKVHDPEAYAFYRQVGATVMPYSATGSDRRRHSDDHDKPDLHRTPLPSWFHQQRPAFGCYAYGADPQTEKYEKTEKHPGKPGSRVWVPKFMYFTKYSAPPPNMQLMSGGDIYVLTIWWDNRHDRKLRRRGGVPQRFGMFVSADGKQVVALRVCDTTMVPIWSKRKHSTFRIPKRAWHIPSAFEEWAKEHHLDVQTFLTETFLRAIERHEHAQYSMVRVAATKDNMTAVFSVNVKRTGYFFQDRDYRLNEEGTRKRIFHIVRPHTRADGTDVKMHFRGEREFSWAGYQISITVPGYDHLNTNEFSAGTLDEYWQLDDEQYLGMPELGERMAKTIKTHHGGLH